MGGERSSVPTRTADSLGSVDQVGSADLPACGYPETRSARGAAGAQALTQRSASSPVTRSAMSSSLLRHESA